MADWSAAIAEAYAHAPAEEYVVRTLELIHPVFVDREGAADSIRVALDERDWDLELESGAPLFAGQTKTFEALAMEASLPAQDEGGMGELKLSLDNVPGTIIQHLKAAVRVRASALLIYREWIAIKSGTPPTYSVSGPPDLIIDQLTVKVVTATRLRLEANASFVDLLNRAFPRRKFSQTDFPGLFGGTT